MDGGSGIWKFTVLFFHTKRQKNVNKNKNFFKAVIIMKVKVEIMFSVYKTENLDFEETLESKTNSLDVQRFFPTIPIYFIALG